jgi:D-alanine transaminase
MEIAYFNGEFLPKDEVKVSPDDRGFLFADGIYEVARWYKGIFYDMESHLIRMKRNLKELRIKWNGEDSLASIAHTLIKQNELEQQDALFYIQITRGAAPRSHSFPYPVVTPTAYAFARSFAPDTTAMENGIAVLLKNEIRWARCDIKSVSLLPNTLGFQEAKEQGYQECIFIRDGIIAEGSHSNIFFVINGALYTHPESNQILSGVTRKNVLRIARESGIPVVEEAVPETMIADINEAFLTSTVAEVTPVVRLEKRIVGEGNPGPVTKMLKDKFLHEITMLKVK